MTEQNEQEPNHTAREIRQMGTMTLRIHMCREFTVKGVQSCQACPNVCAYGKEYLRRYRLKDEGRNDPDSVEALANRIDVACDNYGMTKLVFAHNCGIDKSTIHTICQRQRKPKRETVRKIMDYLNRLEKGKTKTIDREPKSAENLNEMTLPAIVELALRTNGLSKREFSRRNRSRFSEGIISRIAVWKFVSVTMMGRVMDALEELPNQAWIGDTVEIDREKIIARTEAIMKGEIMTAKKKPVEEVPTEATETPKEVAEVTVKHDTMQNPDAPPAQETKTHRGYLTRDQRDKLVSAIGIFTAAASYIGGNLGTTCKNAVLDLSDLLEEIA